jgi:Zn-finger nucleic acid-binding protein
MSEPPTNHSSARGYACPGCGAHVNEQARQCSYCNAPVATLRCARCFHMNVPVATHCSGCGHELGLEPIPEAAELACPSCAEPLATFQGETGKLHDCAKCGGQFVGHRLLKELLVRREVLGSVASAATGGPAPRVPVATAVRYVKCPVCEVHMNRKNFGGSSGVIVDVCSKHGFWFDAGELPRVLFFVESGGLARARKREEDELVEQARAERLKANRRPFEPPQSDAEAEAATADFASAAADLLSFVLRFG